MRLLVLAAGPVVLGAVLWLWLVLRKRAPKRYTVNAIIGVVLFAYFAITTGLGLFWMARQELPAFEPHYVFGYLTLVLVGVHVGVNVRQLLKYVRQNSPKVLVKSDTGEFRAPIRFLWQLGALALASAVGFGLGYRQRVINVVASERPQVREAATAPLSSSSLVSPTPVAEQILAVEGQETTVALFYHRESNSQREPALTLTRKPEILLSFPGAPVVPLPKDFARSPISITVAVDRARRPVEGLFPKPVSLPQLSTLLQMTDGLTGAGRSPQALGMPRTRSAPSAGALYPTDIYVFARNVEGLAQGLYYFNVHEHSLVLVKAGDHVPELAAAAASPALLRGASFVLVLSTEYFRTSHKYGARSYRFCLLDAGHIVENALLGAEYQGLAGRPVARFDDGRVNSLLGIDPAKRAAVVMVPVGQRDDVSATVHLEPPFVAAPIALNNPEVPQLITLAHGRTMLALASPQGRWVAPFAPPAPLAPPTGEATVPLPVPEDTKDDVFATIESRRTQRLWGGEGMTVEQLSTVLKTSAGGTATGLSPSVEGHRDVREYVVAMRVRGLEPGAYAYDPATHSLKLHVKGQLRSKVWAATQQTGPSDSDAVILHAADVDHLSYPDGSRGYRYAAMDAGMAGERVYLSATALGLGTNGVGSFRDDRMAEVVGVPDRKELMFYVTAVGTLSSNTGN